MPAPAPVLRALTVRQPWAWAILHAGKDVENRSWPPPDAIIGQRIALHASKSRDRWSYDGYAELIGAAAPDDLPRGVLIGTVLVAGWVHETGSASDPSIAAYLESRWFQGPYGWVMADPQPAREMYECNGALSLWRVPEWIRL